MNKKIVTRIGIGVALYGVFVAAVLLFYPDNAQDMDWKDRESTTRYKLQSLN